MVRSWWEVEWAGNVEQIQILGDQELLWQVTWLSVVPSCFCVNIHNFLRNLRTWMMQPLIYFFFGFTDRFPYKLHVSHNVVRTLMNHLICVCASGIPHDFFPLLMRFSPTWITILFLWHPSAFSLNATLWGTHGWGQTLK